MTIQVLGSDCPTCKKLFDTTKKVVKELNIDTEVEYIDGVTRMIEMGVMTGPVLAIDNKPVLTGRGYSAEDIKKALTGNLPQKEKSDNSGCSCGCSC